MTKRFNPVLDMNITLINATLKVEEKADRKAFSDTSKAQEDVKEYPVFIRCKITEDPTGINTDAEIQFKLRSADKVEVGQELVLGKDKFKVIGGQLTFWANKSNYHVREWIFAKASAKGDHIDACD